MPAFNWCARAHPTKEEKFTVVQGQYNGGLLPYCYGRVFFWVFLNIGIRNAALYGRRFFFRR
jgi:hypothetical protein